MAMFERKWYHRLVPGYHAFRCTDCGRRLSVPTKFTALAREGGCRFCGNDLEYQP